MNLKINKRIAEICGIHAGDGYLRNDGKRKELDISGNIEEKDYYENHVIPLFLKQFNIIIKCKFFKSRNTYGFVIRDASIIKFMHELGFPYGAKSNNVRMPSRILNDKHLLKYFLRGYFDTDGGVYFSKKYGNYNKFKKKTHNYPSISISTVSKEFFNDLKHALISLGFKPSCCITKHKNKNWNNTHRIFLYGAGQTKKWMKLIGTKNSVKYTRYAIWGRYGFCPTHLTLKQRQNILNRRINPYMFYKGLVA